MGFRKITTFIVDDYMHNVETLTTLLKAYDFIELVGFANNTEDAISEILKLRPKLLMVDIELPGKNGFELISELKEKLDYSFYSILITVHLKFVQPAVEFSVMPLLLKPINPEKLTAAIQIISALIDKEAKSKNESLHFKSKGMDIYLRPTDILWVEANAGDCILFTTNNEEITVSNSFTNVCRMFDEETFIQTHRSYLVQKSAIYSLSRHNGVIIIKNNKFKSAQLVSEGRYKAVNAELNRSKTK